VSNPVFKLQLLIRAEMALSQIRGRRVAARSSLFAVAMVFGLLGVGLINLSGFFYLSTFLSQWLAALVMASINIVFAVIIVMASSKAGPNENEERLAQEMRDMAYKELSEDMEQVKGEVEKIVSDVHRIRDGFSSIASGTAGSFAPLLGMLIKAIKPK
jgi:hypothetical protein